MAMTAKIVEAYEEYKIGGINRAEWAKVVQAADTEELEAACEAIQQEVFARGEAGEITHEEVAEESMGIEMALREVGVQIPE